MSNPRMIRIVPSDYSASMYTQSDELANYGRFVKYEDCGKIVKLLNSEPLIGQTYLRCPYDDDIYFKVEDYEVGAWSRKISHIANIARQLGAINASFVLRTARKRERERTASLNIGSLYGSLTGNYTKEERDMLEAELKHLPSFDPNAHMPTSSEYAKAEEWARVHHLYNDTSVRPLLDMRNPNDGIDNKLSRWEVLFSLSNETNSDLKLAAQLANPDLKLNIDASFEEAVRYEKTIKASIVFEFSLTPA